MPPDFSNYLKFLEPLSTRVDFGAGRLDHVGSWLDPSEWPRLLLVTDPGIVAAGHVERALRSSRAAGIEVVVFDGVTENPTTEHVDAGLAVARDVSIQGIMAVGGGSAMDCAKGINLLYTNGGRIADYWGVNRATAPMLPLIAVPTTAGTGSEAQSFALISDAVTHRKMACGDRRLPKEGGLRPQVAVLDPDLLATTPARVTATAGIDALAHAVETAASTARTEPSRRLSVAAWELMTSGGTHGAAIETLLRNPGEAEARGRMLLGAHLAGAAIEQSMLGAAHACANPLTARFGIAHGAAVGLMLPWVVRFNGQDGRTPYSDLEPAAEDLALTLERFLTAARIPRRLREYGVDEPALSDLSAMAAQEWTAGFNPRTVGAADLLSLYESAL